MKCRMAEIKDVWFRMDLVVFGAKATSKAEKILAQAKNKRGAGSEVAACEKVSITCSPRAILKKVVVKQSWLCLQWQWQRQSGDSRQEHRRRRNVIVTSVRADLPY